MGMKPCSGMVARCSLGALGLIVEDDPVEVIYPDGNKGTAWVGIQLTPKVAGVGEPWSSRNPKVIGHIEDIIEYYKDYHDETC